MKKYESVIIGHITLDENIDYTGKKVYGEGGAVLYSSAAAFGTGHRVAAFTATAEKDKNRLDALRLPKEDVFWVKKEKSTDMYNRYFTADRERRESLCTSRGTPFEKEDFRILPESIPSRRASLRRLRRRNNRVSGRKRQTCRRRTRVSAQSGRERENVFCRLGRERKIHTFDNIS